MHEKIYKSILYFISAVILVTLAIQVYWNYKNYEAGKAQLLRDVHLSLDSAMDQYNTRQLDNNFLSFAIDDLSDEKAFQILDSVSFWIEYTDSGIKFDSTKIQYLENISMYRGAATFDIPKPLKGNILDSLEVRETLQFPIDDTTLDIEKEERSSVAAFSMYTDSLDLKIVNNFVKKELKSLRIEGEIALRYTNLSGEVLEVNSAIFENATLKTVSKSRYLEEGTLFEFAMANQERVIFLRVMLGIIISLVLMIAVIASLLYLLRIIRNQKQMAEIKNDFISNITHEFKTPIATISAALEGIQHFNEEKDSSKTEKYIEMSNDQLSKLNTMVERILDMATLDKDELKVIKTSSNLSVLIEKIVAKHRYLVPQYPIIFNETSDEIITEIDLFHFENAIDNLIDNAVNYGHPPVTIELKKQKEAIVIYITDEGISLTREQADQVFEKFYRVPKGNTHDVKGFGIGLFYTKTIIEKHGGTITVSVKPRTTFKIRLPYV